MVSRHGIGAHSWFDLVLLFFIGGALGLILSGCGPKNHRPPPPPDPFATRRVDQVFYWFLPALANPVAPSVIDPARRKHVEDGFLYQLTAFEDEVGYVWPNYHIYITMDSAWAPCGISNGGGCYTGGTSPPVIWLTSGPWDSAPHAYHELFHAYLHQTTGSVDQLHDDPRWVDIMKRDLDLIPEIIARRP